MKALETELSQTLRLRPGSDRLLSRETSRLEFKETFSLGSLAAYLRTLAAFSNTEGGFIVFGISDSPRRVVGVDRDRFDAVDPARLATHINTYFSPALDWSIGEIELSGKTLGFLHATEHNSKPVICRADAGTDLREGDIYYRYRGQTARIKFPELSRIMEERLEKERIAWREHLERIAVAGPTNVGVIDTVSGRLYGGGHTFLLDERVVDRLKFIKQGKFTELEGGEPTLRLVGDVQPVSTVAPTKPVPVGIHYHEIISAFLAERDLAPTDALVFFREACREDSVYVPIHYFMAKAGLTAEKAVAELNKIPGVHDAHGEVLSQRIRGKHLVSPVGTVETGIAPPSNASALHRELKRQYSPKAERSILLATLVGSPTVVKEAIDKIEPARLSEAITNVPPDVVKAHAGFIKEILLALYLAGFESWEGAVRTTFRKAVARVDEILNRAT